MWRCRAACGVSDLCVARLGRHKTAKQLVSQDFKSNVARFKYTFSVEICPICKDDIVVLPKALAANLGCITPLVLVYQVTNYMRLVSPTTLQTAELTATKYWKHGETRSLMSAERMIEFTVLDCTPVTVTTHSSAASRGPRRSGGRRKRKARGRKRQAAGDDDGDGEDFDDASSIMASTARESGTGFGAAFGGNVGNGLGGMDRFKKRLSGGMSVTSTVAGGPKGKFLLAEVDVARTRDMGVNETTFTVLTHLGNLLKAGDSVLGYDLTGRTFNELDLNGADPEALPEIVLVRKCYPRRRAKKLPRPWQLKRLNAALAGTWLRPAGVAPPDRGSRQKSRLCMPGVLVSLQRARLSARMTSRSWHATWRCSCVTLRRTVPSAARFPCTRVRGAGAVPRRSPSLTVGVRARRWLPRPREHRRVGQAKGRGPE